MKETLKFLREKSHYSQDAVAKKLGISRQSYFKYESGEVTPPVETLQRLCQIYNVSYETVIDNKFGHADKTVEYVIPPQQVSSLASPAPEYGGVSDSRKNLVLFVKNLSYSEKLDLLTIIADSLRAERSEMQSAKY